MDYVVSFSRRRKNCGKHPYFSDRRPEVIVDIQPQPDLLKDYVEKNPITQSIQCNPNMSEHWVNTDKFTTKNQGVFHQEGGWPKDIDSNEVEPKLRYRKKVEKDDEYVMAVKLMGEEMEMYIKQNNAMSIYEEYFAESNDHSSEPPTAKMIAVLRDSHSTGTALRAAATLSWSPEGAGDRKLAVAYTGSALNSFVWDVETTSAPELELIPASPLCCVAYNPRDSNIVLGGALNGLVCFWDIRRGGQAVDTSPIERSHRDVVFDLAWMPSKTSTEFCSASPDGTVLFWDTRRLGEPVETVLLQLKPDGDSSTSLGGVSLDLDPSSPARFLVGTEQGNVLWCNRKGKSATDRILQTYTGHHGPVYSVQRNPFFPRYFLTVGDWTARLWMEDLHMPLMSTRYHAAYLTDGQWSPTRPGVFLTTRRDGVLDIWDYLYKQNDPALSVAVSKASLRCLATSAQGSLVAVGAADGSTSLFRLGDGLSVLQSSEKASISQMLERETKREKNLEAQAREAKANSVKKAENGVQAPKGTEAASIHEVEQEFYRCLNGSET